MGKNIEHYHRTVGFDAILGGGEQFMSIYLSFLASSTNGATVHLAEDVLGDLGVRQAMKKIPKNVRL